MFYHTRRQQNQWILVVQLRSSRELQDRHYFLQNVCVTNYHGYVLVDVLKSHHFLVHDLPPNVLHEYHDGFYQWSRNYLHLCMHNQISYRCRFQNLVPPVTYILNRQYTQPMLFLLRHVLTFPKHSYLVCIVPIYSKCIMLGIVMSSKISTYEQIYISLSVPLSKYCIVHHHFQACAGVFDL